jgi:hypothetical protein
MIIIGIILGFVGLAYLCWLLFALGVYALPLSLLVPLGLPPITAVRGPSERSSSARSQAASPSLPDRSLLRRSDHPLRAQRSHSSSRYQLLSLDIMPHSDSRTLVYPLKVGDRQ